MDSCYQQVQSGESPLSKMLSEAAGRADTRVTVGILLPLFPDRLQFLMDRQLRSLRASDQAGTPGTSEEGSSC